MITQELNDKLTHVGPGTPMGNLMRRYWHPLGSAAELDREPVQPVRLLGESLTLFRVQSSEFKVQSGQPFRVQSSEFKVQSGQPSPNPKPQTPAPIRYGLIAERCAHRGLSLAYGVPQENGLRCAYHGWTYDTQGRVVDMPFEPACLPLKVKAYPVEELGGLVWAYLGPEPVPLLPRWDVLVRQDMDREIIFKPLSCNWLQCMDNSLDPIHFEHLHGVYGNYMMKKLGKPAMLNPARHLKIEFDVFDYGIYKRRLVEGAPEDGEDFTVGHPILFPYILAQGSPEQMSFQIRMPTDDTHTMHIVYNARQRKPDAAPKEPVVRREALQYDEWGRVLGENIVKQDEMAWVGQGPVTDRTSEHLATSDKGLMLYRNLLLENIDKVERGEDPIGIVRDPEINEPMIQIARGSRYAVFQTGVERDMYGGVRVGLAAGVPGIR